LMPIPRLGTRSRIERHEAENDELKSEIHARDDRIASLTVQQLASQRFDRVEQMFSREEGRMKNRRIDIVIKQVN
jgi:hypothetical protein